MAAARELRTFNVYHRPGSEWLRANSREESRTMQELGYPRGLVPAVSLDRFAQNIARCHRYDVLVIRQYGHARQVIDLRTQEYANL